MWINIYWSINWFSRYIDWLCLSKVRVVIKTGFWIGRIGTHGGCVRGDKSWFWLKMGRSCCGVGEKLGEVGTNLVYLVFYFGRSWWYVEILSWTDLLLMGGYPVPELLGGNSFTLVELAEITNNSFEDIWVSEISLECKEFLVNFIGVNSLFIDIINIKKILESNSTK